MDTTNQRQLNIVAAIGLALGAIFGMAGTLVQQDSLRQIFWGIDGVGLIVATVLLGLKYFRQGEDFVASGFLVFAGGETLLLAGTPAGLAASSASFGAGIALWAAGLLLTSVPRVFAFWTRAAGVVAAFLVLIVAARIFAGTQLLPTSSPLPFFAYPFAVLTFIGWILTLLKNN